MFDVAQRPAGGDPVPQRAFDGGRLGEALLAAVPDHLTAQPDGEHPTGAGHEGDRAEIRLERGQQLLGEPGRPREPSAPGAVLDLDPGPCAGRAVSLHGAHPRCGPYPPRGRSGAEHRQPLPGAGRPEDVVHLAHHAELRGGLRRVPVTRVDGDVVGQGAQAAQAVVHRRGVPAREVHPPATLEEQSVPGDEPPVHEEALAARGVTGGVQQADVHRADGDHVVVAVLDELGGPHARPAPHPLGLVPLQVDRDGRALQQLADPLQLDAEGRAADVVGVVVGDQRPGQPHVVGGQHVEQVAHPVGGVDHDGLARLPVTDEVDEVDHLGRGGITHREVTAGQQLAEVQAIAHTASLRSAGPALQNRWSGRTVTHHVPSRGGAVWAEAGEPRTPVEPTPNKNKLTQQKMY
ncbi:hypothetical protein FRAHR75_20175 [Frankia sp. Hr75.2]|nr:hypothetical protein FRAHR75_20175 [Frankia sp. Hr75.2]